MVRRSVPVMALFALAFAGTVAILAAQAPAQKVVVHEWGTFTTVAGDNGYAIDWLPLGGPTDLPCFVQHYKNRQFKIIGDVPEGDGPIEYDAARGALVAKVRMETPVLYFYSPTDAAVSVDIRFPQGLMTDWYPTAQTTQPNVVPTILQNPNVASVLRWPDVRISPGHAANLPTGSGKSHYYAARETDASPVSVQGQDEKFLFYRGVASFPVPITATLADDGTVRVTNLAAESIPTVILFENRAGVMSYHSVGALKATATIARPTARADFATLRTDLIASLVHAGLFQREAEAMVETWRDSWFEEGTRVFYVLPASTVDAVLPLSIAPAPTSIARAFVGRMEIVTPESLVLVQTAIAKNDLAALERQGRFLGPITDRLVAHMSSVSDRERIKAIANAVFNNYLTKYSSCQ